ncbi:diheme cytochrome c SoxD [Oceanicola granulosus HTCC2516]|uniref:Diheme cytochrome c SoxD n=1 Tax=Oceanicola granulosus (strain ATCC BAA-861 / DSM 15982 / KCTC 12143 / HTCC2516) TaxID=314256 RepID=Q2CI91_OCEGH|nr:cytochrome c family protein [Oceanicola granulosus]EAR52367.1 diheme cytochrome c SoxD [Oceanicola granulosus HTCC2516]
MLAAAALAMLPGALAAQDAPSAAPDPELVAEGEDVFRRCRSCHMVGEDAQSRVGPMLNGIFGQPAAVHQDDFRYSDAMIEAGEEGLVWTHETLAAYLESPRDYVPGTRMAFAGLRTEEERVAVVAYLQTFSPDYDPAEMDGEAAMDDEGDMAAEESEGEDAAE